MATDESTISPTSPTAPDAVPAPTTTAVVSPAPEPVAPTTTIDAAPPAPLVPSAPSAPSSVATTEVDASTLLVRVADSVARAGHGLAELNFTFLPNGGLVAEAKRIEPNGSWSARQVFTPPFLLSDTTHADFARACDALEDAS